MGSWLTTRGLRYLKYCPVCVCVELKFSADVPSKVFIDLSKGFFFALLKGSCGGDEGQSYNHNPNTLCGQDVR